MLKPLFFSGLLGLSLASLSFTASAIKISESEFVQIQQDAKQGNAEAQTVLGLAYFSGKEVSNISKDIKQGIYWLEKAAKQGDFHAKGYLGAIYYEGRGVKKDPRKGLNYLQESCQKELLAKKRELAGCTLLIRGCENGNKEMCDITTKLNMN
ncbi:MAG: tetratricopeptide repeat protein [Pasteurellaceae bacterium]|nr:tetratricopeptide repeat protein [Pasteurellaceae bacterium]